MCHLTFAFQQTNSGWAQRPARPDSVSRRRGSERDTTHAPPLGSWSGWQWRCGTCKQRESDAARPWSSNMLPNQGGEVGHTTTLLLHPISRTKVLRLSQRGELVVELHIVVDFECVEYRLRSTTVEVSMLARCWLGSRSHHA